MLSDTQPNQYIFFLHDVKEQIRFPRNPVETIIYSQYHRAPGAEKNLVHHYFNPVCKCGPHTDFTEAELPSGRNSSSRYFSSVLPDNNIS